MSKKAPVVKQNGMKLTVFDRMVLGNIMPREGDITCLRLIREFKEDLSFSETENKALGFKQLEDGRTRWNPKLKISKNVVIGDTIRGIIVKRLKDLNKEKKLSEDHIDLYDRFVEPNGT